MRPSGQNSSYEIELEIGKHGKFVNSGVEGGNNSQFSY